MNTDISDTENERFCRICHEVGPDEDGQHPITGCCSCSGTMGNVHMSCAMKFAQTRTIDEMNSGIGEFTAIIDYWQHCDVCKQEWTGDMLASIGSKCVEFMDEEFPKEDDLKIMARGIQRYGFTASGVRTKEEEVQACEEVLIAIKEYESTTQLEVIPAPILHEKYIALRIVGQSIQVDNPILAIKYFEECKDILHKMGCSIDDIRVLEVHTFIARAKMELPEVDKMEALETLFQHENRLFQVLKESEDYGEDHHDTIVAGVQLAAVTLIEMQRFVDATQLLHDLHETVRRVHGSEHVYTKAIQEFMERILDKNDANEESDDTSMLLNQTV